MSLDSQLYKIPAKLRMRYLHNMGAIRQFQIMGKKLRDEVRQDPVRNGHLLTREMHPIEMDVLKVLCPGVGADNARERQKALYWVLNQEWGKDLRASPYDQRYFIGKPANA